MLHRSIIETRGLAAFPDYTGERVYMEPFLKADGLPAHLARWQPTVDAMLDGIDTDHPVYIMIDQSPVKAGATQRRPGLHIDGYWNPGITAHGNTPGLPLRHQGISPNRHQPSQPIHRPAPSHRQVPPVRHGSMSSLGRHGHRMTSAIGRHYGHRPGIDSTWADATFDAPEGIILASTISAARGFVGDYEGVIGDMGDCAHIDVSGLDVLPMVAGQVYAGNVNCLHESLPVHTDCLRSLVRLNVPGWTPRG